MEQIDGCTWEGKWVRALENGLKKEMINKSNCLGGVLLTSTSMLFVNN